MAGHITLQDALDSIHSALSKQRAEGLADLKHILRHNQNNSKIGGLKEKSFFTIFQSLFQAAIDVRSSLIKAKTQATRSTCTSRLSDVASALRESIEAGVKVLTLKTVNSIVDHVVQTIFYQHGDAFCEPLALDYAKCLRIVLAYQPHVEVLGKRWESTVMFCIKCIKKAEAEAGETNGVNPASTMGAVPGMSYRSSHSTYRETGSQGSRSVSKPIADEMITCLHLLTAPPIAPISIKAPDILWTVIEYLQSSAAATRSHQNAFLAINHVIAWSRTESIGLTQEATSHLVRLVGQFWLAKSTAKDEMLSTLLLIRPFILHAMRTSQVLTLRPDLIRLSQAIQNEYSRRQDSRQLALEDLRLDHQSPEEDDVATQLFNLRCSDARAESNWVLVFMLASFYNMLTSNNGTDEPSVQDDSIDDIDLEPRPKKRARLDDEMTQLIESASRDSPQSKACAIQTLSFLVQEKALSTRHLSALMSGMAANCNEDSGSVSSWAYLALACCASQRLAQDAVLSGQWASVWQLSIRGLSNASTSRAASYVLHLMLKLRLVQQASISELVQMFTHSIDLGGPTLLSDASALLLRSTLEASQHLNPGLSSVTADSIINWLSRNFTPSRLDDKSYVASCLAFEARDVVSLIHTCLNLHPHLHAGLKVWNSLARTWILCNRHRATVSYLLLDPIDQPVANEEISSKTPLMPVLSTSPRTTTEALVLNHLTAEIARTSDAWKLHGKQPSTDTFSMLCKASTAVLCVANCISYKDGRRQSNLRAQSKVFFTGICDFISSARCEDPSADALLLVASGMFGGLADCRDDEQFNSHPCERCVCQELKIALARREDLKMAVVDDDAMELDDAFDSQDSGKGQASSKEVDLLDDFDASFSRTSLRSSTTLYCHTLAALNQDESRTTANAVSKAMSFLLSRPDVFILTSRKVITMWSRPGLTVTTEDAESLLEHLMKMFDKYALKRSEVALGTALDVALSLISLWTDPTHGSLFGLGLDIYEFYLQTFLPNGLLSQNVQKRLATLLLRLCDINLEYGCEESPESPTPSARTGLFNLVGTTFITVQFYLADHIPDIFGHFVLSYHAVLLEDLLSKLKSEVLWHEAGALRLLFLSKLAARWPSLLTQCVYHLFDSAGRVEESRHYAKRCIEELAAHLPSKSPRKLFSLFAPQILYTWLEKEDLAKVPYEAFQYGSLREFLATNQTEICAQLVLRESKEGFEVMERVLKRLRKDLVKAAFPKSTAYAICQDVSTRPSASTQSSKQSEQCLKEIVGKETMGELIMLQLPTIIGHFYLTTRQNDPREGWLEKRPGYGTAWKALQEMKGYSHSSREVPNGQQPHYRGRYLPDEIERLYKRTSYNDAALWNGSTFPLAVRMLIDAIDGSLGTLHACLMIRRLRDLICMAAEVAFDGFAMEMLLHALRPFVSDSECADDTIGILRYLFEHGRQYLRTQPLFLTGTVVLLILQMRAHSHKKQDRTTQESQHSSTVQKMIGFQKWLVQFLSDTTEQENPAHSVLTKALDLVQLPGNARIGSAESSLLLFLLEQWQSGRPLCSRKDTMEAIRLLGLHFEAPSSVADDCLGDDSAAIQYYQPLWEIIQSGTMTGEIEAWATQTLGRAYAASGIRANTRSYHTTNLRERILAKGKDQGIFFSQAVIAERLTDLLYSNDRIEAGLADFTLRRILETPTQYTDDAENFEKLLPKAVEDAFLGGTYGYEPASAIQQSASRAVEGKAIGEALATSNLETLEQWSGRLAATMCSWATDVPVVSCLTPLVQNVDALAVELLPSILHILLCKEVDTVPALRPELSAAVVTCLSQTEPSFKLKQRFLLRLVLYLRSRPHPNEATKADRLQWLDVDCLLLAEAASKVNMPTTALLFAESSTPMSHSSKRSSARASTSQMQPVQASEELLLSIYQQIEEPDSFYGVSQPASLDSVLNRLDHEQDGFRSLMFRSAQMDSRMRSQHKILETDAVGMVRSLSSLNFNSLAYTLLNNGLGGTAGMSNEVLRAAKTLQQWDITPPDTHSGGASLTFSIFQELSRATELQHIRQVAQNAIIGHAARGVSAGKSEVPESPWLNTLASVTEIRELLSCSSASEIQARWYTMQQRNTWMHMARFDDVQSILSDRQTFFSTLRQNINLQKALHLTPKQCHSFEIEALLDLSRLSREHMKLQEALTSTTSLSALVQQCKATNLNIEAAVTAETASVLWLAEEASSSVRMLRDALNMPDIERQDVSVGRAGLLAQLGHQLGEARLEKPEDILGKYLKPAINHLKDRKDDKEAGNVFYEFARFCDNEYQNPGNVENFHRMIKLRQGKEEEVETIKAAIKNARRTGQDRGDLYKQLSRAEKWLEIDKAEEKRLTNGRKFYVHQTLQNYLSALRATDEHDICVLRFFAMWLENADDQDANGVVSKYLPYVPSWKLVLLMNQLMSRVEKAPSAFQEALQRLLARIFVDHPWHSIHHLFAAQHGKSGSSDPAAASRYNAALEIFSHITKDQKRRELLERIFNANRHYKMVAEEVTPNTRPGRAQVKDFPCTNRMSRKIPTMALPPATVSLPLRPSAEYNDVPTIVRWEDKLMIMHGISAPKTLTAIASDGKAYKQLFKSGDDDLRQDAIMEQVFGEVSKMLRNHKATRQRDLKVRTYKVIPLTTGCGIIEFVPNSIPLNDFLRPAHKRYYPQDYGDQRARDIINAVKDASVDQRLKEYRKVCDRLHPVLRHFFFELFDDPDEWFEKRTNYTRTTASISILGHILGLGDRHCSNILLDQQTGECVHIDLGVAFEAGRILPIPEMVPFRLTRDVVDGMGATGTEGVFRRCCEFTLDAVRDDKDSIMTLLNVLRYDPLYNWTLSPVRAKRMQEAQDTGRNGAAPEQGSSKRREQEAGEADRSLSIVERKLSKTLSTAATVNELIQQATDEKHLATLFSGWAAYY